jgi:hypothetical protein
MGNATLMRKTIFLKEKNLKKLYHVRHELRTIVDNAV